MNRQHTNLYTASYNPYHVELSGREHVIRGCEDAIKMIDELIDKEPDEARKADLMRWRTETIEMHQRYFLN